MQVEDYSDKSVVVFGETKPFYGYLKEITGGKYISTIRDNTGGWVFSKKKESEVRDLVKKANEGGLSTKPKAPYGKDVKPSFLEKDVKPSQPLQEMIFQKDVAITIQCPTMNYQVLLYKTVKPSLGQKVTIKTKDETMTYIVKSINSVSDAVDDITLDNGFRAVIMCGTWKVVDLINQSHEVVI